MRSRCRVRVQNREHEAQIARDGRLAREEKLDPLLGTQVGVVDVVVERDHLGRQLAVASHKRLDCSAQRAEDELRLLVDGASRPLSSS
jgi:hypothetical protein